MEAAGWSLFPLGMNDAWLLPALSVLAFVLIVLWGRYLPGRGAYVAIAAIGLGFVLFWPILVELLYTKPGEFSFTWLHIPKPEFPGLAFPGFELRFGMIVDNLSVLMLGVVTSVAFAVQVYSLGYMRGDPHFSWYFAAHSLFAASMLGLVLADNFLLLYITWELVGLCSYLLIGHWWERRSAAEAAKKAFVTTRIGDVAFLAGVLILWKTTGTLQLSTIFQMAEHGEIALGTLTLASILIFGGAMGKSAQFPLHVWLPDAMEGPTPVSALIHAATMVAAGVYLVARVFPLLLAAPYALQLIAIIGLITAFIAATMGLVMTDFKRVLAYSTVSQLGFMMVSLGSLGYTAGMFHLMNHAFFKALLFLGAGSVIHATEKQEIWEMGGLWRKMPITAITFVIAAIALAGVPPLSGFWSKDEILFSVLQNQSPLFFATVVLTAFMSAFYMTRLFLVVFFGPLKPEMEHHAHESPWVMTVPLILLAFLSVTSGWLTFDFPWRWFNLPAQWAGMGTFLYSHEPEAFHPNYPLMILSTVVSLLGIFLGWLIYGKKAISNEAIGARFATLYRLLRNKYYLDDLYQWVIDKVVLVLAAVVAWFDRVVVNDVGVNGPAYATGWTGERLRYHVTGRLYNYGLAIVAGVVVIIIAAFAMQA